MCIRRRHSGFSILEILAALSIAVILTALLVPALSAAKENGKRAVCSQNLHQIGVQTQSFAQGNRGGLFPVLNMSLATNADNTINVLTTTRTDFGGGWSGYQAGSFRCPSEENPGTVTIQNPNGTTRKMSVSYGYHIRMMYNGISWSDSRLGPPSDVVTFYDGSMSGIDSTTGKNIEGNYVSTMDFALTALTYRHRTRYAQAVFADGHVKTFDFFDQSYISGFGGGNAPVTTLRPTSTSSASASTGSSTGSTTGSTTGSSGGGDDHSDHDGDDHGGDDHSDHGGDDHGISDHGDDHDEIDDHGNSHAASGSGSHNCRGLDGTDTCHPSPACTPVGRPAGSCTPSTGGSGSNSVPAGSGCHENGTVNDVRRCGH